MPSQRPAISILLPFRDAGPWLDECLDSIQAQSFRDFELLAVDDHSRDGSAARVRRRRDGRFRLLRPRGRGLVAALNTGLAAARAPLVARMDADDRMHPERLQRQYHALMRDPTLMLVAGRARAFPDALVRDGMRAYLAWQDGLHTPREIARELFVEAPFAHPSVCFRRALVQRVGPYRAGPFPEDYDLWLRAQAAGLRMARLPHTLIDWRESPGRVSRTAAHCSREAFDRLRARYLARWLRRHLPTARPLVVWGAGRRTRQRVRHLQQRGWTPQAWIDIDPRKIGNRIEGQPVYPPKWLVSARPRPFVLVYVAVHGARELIEAELAGMGYDKGRDFLSVG